MGHRRCALHPAIATEVHPQGGEVLECPAGEVDRKMIATCRGGRTPGQDHPQGGEAGNDHTHIQDHHHVRHHQDEEEEARRQEVPHADAGVLVTAHIAVIVEAGAGAGHEAEIGVEAEEAEGAGRWRIDDFYRL